MMETRVTMMAVVHSVFWNLVVHVTTSVVKNVITETVKIAAAMLSVEEIVAKAVTVTPVHPSETVPVYLCVSKESA